MSLCGRRTARGGRLALLAAIALLVGALAALRPAEATAHPLGNFTVNHYSRLDFADDAVLVTYVLDFAEIPTFQRMKALDPNGDGSLDAAEAVAYLDAELPGILRGLELIVAGRPLLPTVVARSVAFLPGQGGLPTLRIEAKLRATLPGGWRANGAGRYADRNLPERIGWREIVVRGGAGVAVADSTAAAEDRSDELRSYPQELLDSPLALDEATFRLVPGAGAGGDTAGRAAARIETSARAPGGAGQPAIAALVRLDQTTPLVALLSLLAATVWGASHALSPGHGKTVVAAYLVGTRGTAKHAAFLGLTVTVTHTIGVFALGGITLALSRYLLPETLYPWLSLASGLLVVAIGVALAYQRLRALLGRDAPPVADHDHADVAPGAADAGDYARGLAHAHGGVTHRHAVPGRGDGRVTWRDLLALGVSGGLIPCPSALILLLGAVAIGRAGFGLLLVLAFSAGLALVLTAIGLVLVWARRFFARFSFEARLPGLLPIAGALAITLAGAAIVYGALGQLGLV